MNLTISICFLSYQRVNLLLKNLNSLVQWLEEYCDKSLIEIDIFDNNSNEVLLIDEFIKKRKNKTVSINLHKNDKNIGYPSNLIKAISTVKTEYIWIFSDDDFFNFKKLDELLNAIFKNKPDFCIANTINTNGTISPLGLPKNDSIFYFKPELNNLLKNELNFDLDKHLGFISSNICRTSLLKKALKIVQKNYPYMLSNNYVNKAINYLVISLSNSTLIQSKAHYVIQNLENGSYFYNEPKVRRQVFIFDLIDVYKFLSSFYSFNLSKKSLKLISNRYFGGYSLWYSLKKDNHLYLSDLIKIYRETNFKPIFGLLIYIFPKFILNFFRIIIYKFKNINKS